MHPCFQLLIRQPFLINAVQCKQASVAATFESENAGADESRNRHDTARRARLREPRNVFCLLSVCAGHNRTSGCGPGPRGETSLGVWKQEANPQLQAWEMPASPRGENQRGKPLRRRIRSPSML